MPYMAYMAASILDSRLPPVLIAGRGGQIKTCTLRPFAIHVEPPSCVAHSVGMLTYLPLALGAVRGVVQKQTCLKFFFSVLTSHYSCEVLEKTQKRQCLWEVGSYQETRSIPGNTYVLRQVPSSACA